MIEASALNDTRQNAVFPESTTALPPRSRNRLTAFIASNDQYSLCPTTNSTWYPSRTSRIEMQVGVAQDVVMSSPASPARSA